MKFVALDRTLDAHMFAGTVRTNERVRKSFELMASQGNWGGDLYGPRRATHKIDYATDVVTVRFPRSTLSRPRWVQGQVPGGHWDQRSPP
jgi:hypothetical protein